MDNSKLRVWPKSHKYCTMNNNFIKYQSHKIKGVDVLLDKGDILVFRGDLVHAGSSYKDDNIRIHAYLDSPVVPRDKNTTFIIKKHASDELKNIIDEN